MEAIYKSAFEKAIAIEIKSLSFYQTVSLIVRDNSTKRVFEVLAKEESSHLDLLCNLFPDNAEELVSILTKSYSSVFSDPYYMTLLNTVQFNTSEKDALQIALKEEQSCINCYTPFVEFFRETRIHDVFSRILNETHKHCEMISEEYMRLMHMVDQTDQLSFVRE